MKPLKNLLWVLSTGYCLFYFSEQLFWARVRPDDSLVGWVLTWLAYSLVGFIFLVAVSHYHVKNRWALFLAGALVGWLAEGVLVQTTYESLPLSISFTGLAWHALISVWVGWYAVQRTLSSENRFSTLILASVIGFFYGLWAITWWLEPDGGVASLADFAIFSSLATLLFMLSVWVARWSASEPFTPNRWVVRVVIGLFGLYFVAVTVPTAPLAIVILPILLGLVYLGLRQNRRLVAEGSLLDNIYAPVSAWKILSVLALPLTAIVVYALALSLGLAWHTNWVLYLVTTPVGFILFGYSLYKMRV